MKKVVFIIILVVFAQTTSAQNVTFGVKGGVNYSKVLTSNDVGGYPGNDRFKYKFGFQIGGFAKIKLIEKLYIQPELLYSLQGTKSINYQTRGFHDSDESNIILPILFKYYFFEKISVEFGPQFDYLFLIKQDGEVLDYGNYSFSEMDAARKVSDISWGLDFGVGYDFNKKIGVEIRYNYGFDRKKDDGTSYLPDFNNSVFQLNFEYRFN